MVVPRKTAVRRLEPQLAWGSHGVARRILRVGKRREFGVRGVWNSADAPDRCYRLQYAYASRLCCSTRLPRAYRLHTAPDRPVCAIDAYASCPCIGTTRTARSPRALPSNGPLAVDHDPGNGLRARAAPHAAHRDHASPTKRVSQSSAAPTARENLCTLHTGHAHTHTTTLWVEVSTERLWRWEGQQSELWGGACWSTVNGYRPMHNTGGGLKISADFATLSVV
jgi:hypothetical protein